MAWAQEMKNLAAEIKTGHRDRTARIREIKRETRDILGEADDYMERVAADLREAAKALRDFLAKSEASRKKDFSVMMGEIQARIKEIRGDVKDFLAKSEERRIADFKALMKDVIGTVEAIEKSTKALLNDYKAERKEAAGHWTSLSKKPRIAEEAEKEFKCEVCGKEFGSKIALIGHMRSHE